MMNTRDDQTGRILGFVIAFAFAFAFAFTFTFTTLIKVHYRLRRALTLKGGMLGQ